MVPVVVECWLMADWGWWWLSIGIELDRSSGS